MEKFINLNDFYGTEAVTDDMVENFICLMFDGYQQRKQNGSLYNSGKIIPAILIKTYYNHLSGKLELSDTYGKFKKRYILNENKLEAVHEYKERLGLGEVYDYIDRFNDKSWINIYIILQIHALLYSKVNYPEFGGKFRQENCFITNSDVSTTPYHLISAEIKELYEPFEQLLEHAKVVKRDKNPEDLMKYINEVIKFKCKLIKIHPFKDGNGRTCRALVNLMFKNIDLPPVYVMPKEKEEYIKAMDAAVRLNNYDLIEGFYYYKICDSIIELGFDKTVGQKQEAKKTN